MAMEGEFEDYPLTNEQKLWREAATHYATLRAVGIILPWNDALVATLAISKNCRVYAIDQHFESLAQHLELQLYKPGYNGSFAPEAID